MTIVEFSMAAAESTKELVEGLVDGVTVTLRDEFGLEREAILSQQTDLGWNAEDERVDPVHAPYAIAVDIEGDSVDESAIHEMLDMKDELLS